MGTVVAAQATRAEKPKRKIRNAKVLRDLVHAGVLSSTRGIGGGFRLRRRATSLKLIDIIRPFEDVFASKRCPFGHVRCSDDNPCSMHERWKPVKTAFQTLLEETTLSEIIDEEGD